MSPSTKDVKSKEKKSGDERKNEAFDDEYVLEDAAQCEPGDGGTKE